MAFPPPPRKNRDVNLGTPKFSLLLNAPLQHIKRSHSVQIQNQLRIYAGLWEQCIFKSFSYTMTMRLLCWTGSVSTLSFSPYDTLVSCDKKFIVHYICWILD